MTIENFTTANGLGVSFVVFSDGPGGALNFDVDGRTTTLPLAVDDVAPFGAVVEALGKALGVTDRPSRADLRMAMWELMNRYLGDEGLPALALGQFRQVLTAAETEARAVARHELRQA